MNTNYEWNLDFPNITYDKMMEIRHAAIKCDFFGKFAAEVSTEYRRGALGLPLFGEYTHRDTKEFVIDVLINASTLDANQGHVWCELTASKAKEIYDWLRSLNFDVYIMDEDVLPLYKSWAGYSDKEPSHKYFVGFSVNLYTKSSKEKSK